MLKRCFCCGKAGKYYSELTYRPMVTCSNISCSISTRVFEIDEWNTRAIEDELEEKLSKQSEEVQSKWLSPVEVAGLKLILKDILNSIEKRGF